MRMIITNWALKWLYFDLTLAISLSLLVSEKHRSAAQQLFGELHAPAILTAAIKNDSTLDLDSHVNVVTRANHYDVVSRDAR